MSEAKCACKCVCKCECCPPPRHSYRQRLAEPSDTAVLALTVLLLAVLLLPICLLITSRPPPACVVPSAGHQD